MDVPDSQLSELTLNVGRQTTQRQTAAMSVLPMELQLELVLITSFIALFNDNYKTKEAIPLAYSMLAAVCFNWWQTMNGWPQSPTRHWFKHKLFRGLKHTCRPYVMVPLLQSTFEVSDEVCDVFGVTQCDNTVFVVCRFSNVVDVFGSNNKPIAHMQLEQMKSSTDIVSCHETQQLYIAGMSHDSRCVWRLSLDSGQVVRWLPNTTTTTLRFTPWTLSVTSRRLLVTSLNNELLLYGADGVELKRVPLPDMTSLEHSVETSRGTFIVCHTKPKLGGICEVNVDGHVTRVYCHQQQLSDPRYLSLDSDGRIFVADNIKHRVLLLNGETLELDRVLLDKQQLQLTYPPRMCYAEQTGQLAVNSNSWNVTSGKMHHCVKLFSVRVSTDSQTA